MDAYFFDLDGTLCDSRPGLVQALRASFAALGIETDQDPAEFIGAPLPAIFRALVADIDEVDIAYGMLKFREAYESVGITRAPLYPGTEEMLATLHAQGRIVWLVTAKPQDQARRVLQNLALTRFFSGIAGAGDAEADPKSAILQRALKDSRADPRQALMLGDRTFDVAAAQACAVRPVGALWGYGSRAELAGAGCREFAASIAEFVRVYVDTP